MSKRWTVGELTKLAEGRTEGLTYPEVQERYFPHRTVASVRAAAQTSKYKEVLDALDQTPDVFVAGEGVAKFRFPGIGVELDAETFADLVRSYVSSGRNLTRAGVARRFGLTVEQVDHICRVYGLTKDSPPVPRELLALEDDDAIVDAALQAREQGIVEAVERKRASYFERKYRKTLRQLQDRDAALARLDEWLASRADKFGATPPPIKRLSAGPVPAVHIPTADLHVGKLSWAQEVGHHYDTNIACNRLREHGLWARGELELRGGTDVAYVTDVGDFFHAILSMTESGTSLDKDTRDLKVFDATLEAKIAQIDAIRQAAAKVVVISVPGNHDHIFSHLFQRMLALHYEGVPDVEVRVGYGRFSGFVVGRTAHLLDHGKGVSSLTGWKPKAQIATVRKHALPPHKLDTVRRNVYYCGHLHELQVATFTDMELRRLFPLGEADDFEVSLRYDGSPGAEIFFLDADGDIRGTERFKPARMAKRWEEAA